MTRHQSFSHDQKADVHSPTPCHQLIHKVKEISKRREPDPVWKSVLCNIFNLGVTVMIVSFTQEVLDKPCAKTSKTFDMSRKETYG